jgi:predicted nucleic acid-binding Zn ribbon protein
MRPTNESPLGEVIRRMMEKYDLTEGLLNERITELWHSTVSEAVSNRTRHIRFSSGILTIGLNSSVLSHELSMMREDLMNELNNKLESPVIQEIRIQ